MILCLFCNQIQITNGLRSGYNHRTNLHEEITTNYIMNNDTEKSTILGFTFVVLATAFWAISGILISHIIARTGISSAGLAFWRDFFTFLTLGAVLLITDRKAFRIERVDIPWLAGLGALSIGFFHILWNYTVVVNGVSIATIIQCNAPIFVTFMSYFIFRESLNWQKILALVASVIGTILITDISQVSSHTVTTMGLIAGLGSAIAYGTFSLFSKKLQGNYKPLTILFYVFAFASLTLLPAEIIVKDPFPTASWLEFAFLITFPTITGFGLYSQGLKYLDAGVASITAMTEIPFAAIFAYFFLAERLSFIQILGGLFVVLGVVLVTQARRRHRLRVIR